MDLAQNGPSSAHLSPSPTKQRASTMPLSEPGPTDRPDFDRIDSSSDPGHRFSTFTAASSTSESEPHPGLHPRGTEVGLRDDAARLSYGENASGAPSGSTHSYVSFDTESGPEDTPQDEQFSHGLQRLATESDSDEGPYDISEENVPYSSETNQDETIRQSLKPLPRAPLADIVNPEEDHPASLATDAAASAALAALLAGTQEEAPLPDLPGTFPSSDDTQEPGSHNDEQFQPKDLGTPRRVSIDTSATPKVAASMPPENDAKFALAQKDSADSALAVVSPIKAEDAVAVLPDAAAISAHIEPSALTKSESVRVPRSIRLSASRPSPTVRPVTPSDQDVRTPRQSISQATPRQSTSQTTRPLVAGKLPDAPKAAETSATAPNTGPRRSIADDKRPSAVGATNATRALASPVAPSKALPVATPTAAKDSEKAVSSTPSSKPVEPNAERNGISTQDRAVDNPTRPPLPTNVSQMDTQYVNMLLALDGIPVSALVVLSCTDSN